MDPNDAEVADDCKRFDEESGLGRPDKKDRIGSSNSGDSSKQDDASSSVVQKDSIKKWNLREEILTK